MIALGGLALAYGFFALGRARYDVFPEFAPPEVTVETEAPGLAPEQVEQLVTQSIENAVNGVPGVQAMRSQSIQGVSNIVMTFDPEVDVFRERQLVAERLASVAAELPQGVQAPRLTPLFSSTGDALIVGLTSQTASLMDQRALADWIVRPQLLAVPGVANVAIFGGEERQIQIQLDPDKLVRRGVAVDEILAASRDATAVEGTGFVETPNQRLPVQAAGQVTSPASLALTVVRWRDGQAVTLGDVADVREASALASGSATIMGRPGVILRVSLQYGSNTLAVTRGLDAALRDLGPILRAQDVTLHPDLFRAASFIETALHNVRTSLLLGAGLVVVVLFLFLFNFRTAIISCLAIPLSLLTAAVVLEKLGFSLNTMTMGGLAIAIGEVVDDAVIDVENILRRLRENQRTARPQPAFRVVLTASLEVRSAVVFATFAVALVFVPVMTLSGLAGRMFAPLGAAYIAAVLASLLVAVTVTPALSLVLLRPGSYGSEESPLARWLHRNYGRVLRGVERHRRAVVALVVLATLAGAAVVPFLEGGFLPELQEKHLILHVTMAPGTSLAASARLGINITHVLLELPGIRAASQMIGRASFTEVHGPQVSEIQIRLNPDANTSAVKRSIEQAVAGMPGASFSVNSFFSERVEETLSGYTAPVVVDLFGEDRDALDRAAQTVSRTLSSLRGATGVQLPAPPATPEIALRLRPDDLRRHGLNPVAALDAVRVAYRGERVGQIHEGSRTTDVVVILAPARRHEPTLIGRLPLRAPGEHVVQLAQVADIYPASGRSLILHEGARRVQIVTCDVRGRSVSGFVADARAAIEKPGVLPAGIVAHFAGSAQAQTRARRDLLVHGLMAGAGIVLLLSIVLGHRNNLALVLVNLPFALIGGVAVVTVFGGDVSLGALVGFVTVFGITLRNSIMLLSHYEHLVTTEEQAWTPETSVRGAMERLVPILMTALVTGLGLLPLALAYGTAGREIEGPMAVVILGGLATSTALNLLVLPTLALRWARWPEPRAQ